MHADRGFLHGWLCDAKRHPKPFTISAVQAGIPISQNLPFRFGLRTVYSGVFSYWQLSVATVDSAETGLSNHGDRTGDNGDLHFDGELGIAAGLAVALALRGHWMRAAAVVTPDGSNEHLHPRRRWHFWHRRQHFRTIAAHRGWSDLVGSAPKLILLVLTQGPWVNTLQYGTPCGEEFAWYGGSTPTMVTLILVGYLVLPLFLAISAACSVMKRVGGPEWPPTNRLLPARSCLSRD